MHGMTDDEIARLRTAVLRVARRMRRLSAEEGLTPAQSGLLATLVRRGPTRAGDLAACEGLNPTMLSRVLGLLADDGLLVRTPDPRDRRSVLVEATPAGRRLRERTRKARAATLRDHLDHLGPEQLSTLHEALPILEALAHTLKEARA